MLWASSGEAVFGLVAISTLCPNLRVPPRFGSPAGLEAACVETVGWAGLAASAGWAASAGLAAAAGAEVAAGAAGFAAAAGAVAAGAAGLAASAGLAGAEVGAGAGACG